MVVLSTAAASSTPYDDHNSVNLNSSFVFDASAELSFMSVCKHGD